MMLWRCEKEVLYISFISECFSLLTEQWPDVQPVAKCSSLSWSSPSYMAWSSSSASSQSTLFVKRQCVGSEVANDSGRRSYVVLQWNHHRHPQDLILKKVTEDPGEYLHFQRFPSAWKSKSFIVSACVFGFPSPSVSVVNRLLKAPSGVLPALGFSPGTVCSRVCVFVCLKEGSSAWGLVQPLSGRGRCTRGHIREESAGPRCRG